MKKIAVIGAGTMGNGIAHTFAQNNFCVNLIDISEESLKKGLNTISKNLGIKITQIGKMTSINNKSIIIDQKGQEIVIKNKGYLHRF